LISAACAHFRAESTVLRFAKSGKAAGSFDHLAAAREPRASLSDEVACEICRSAHTAHVGMLRNHQFAINALFTMNTPFTMRTNP
jgi:hypothetical protein